MSLSLNYVNRIKKEKSLSSKEEIELAKRIKSGDKSAENLLIKSNLLFVISVAKKYENQGVSLEDLVQAGNLGLIEAAKRFDPDKNFKFISYAVWWIRQSIFLEISNQSRPVKLGPNNNNIMQLIQKAIDKYQSIRGCNPSVKEVSKLINISEYKIKDLMDLHIFSLNLMSDSQTGEELIEKLPGEDLGSQKPGILDEKSLNLNSYQKFVLEQYFGLNEDEMSFTLQQISEKLNMTRESVRIIKKKTLLKLRKKFK